MSRYTQQTLLPEEKISYYTKPHFIIFYSIPLWLICGIWIYNNSSIFMGVLLLLMGIGDGISKLITFYCSEYVITNKRVIMKTGFISRQSFEIFLERIEGIYVEQSVIGRILNFGTVIVGGVGGSKNSFFYIPKPLDFRSNVQQQMQNKTIK